MTAPFPEWFVPMAATLTQERFSGPEWVFERKLDGIRVLAFKYGADVHYAARMGVARAGHPAPGPLRVRSRSPRRVMGGERAQSR